MNVYRFAEKMRSFLISRSFQSYRLWQIRLAILMGSLLELGVVPVILVFLGKRIDAALGFRSVLPSPIIPWATTTCFLLGIPWLGSSILWQHRYGKGTPLPLVPTKVLLTTGPYRCTRNPMLFGAVFWLSGWAMLANSPSALFGAIGVFPGIVISYVKLIEEQELEQRFGDAYREYRRQTPFLIPRVRF